MKDAAASHHLYLEALKESEHAVWQEYLDQLAEFKPDVVGFSVLTVKYASAVKLAKLTKEFDSRIITVAGGEHVTVRPQDALSAEFDYVITGEEYWGQPPLIGFFWYWGQYWGQPPLIGFFCGSQTVKKLEPNCRFNTAYSST